MIPKRIGKSLALKWTILSVLLVAVPLALACFSILTIYHENLKQSVIAVETEKADMVVDRTWFFLEKTTSNLRSLLLDEDLRQGMPSAHMKDMMENFLGKNGHVSELTVLDEKGQETIKVSRHRTFKPSELKDRSNAEFFRAASNLRNYYGDFKLTKDSTPTMLIAIPIREYRKQPTDVLCAVVHLRYISALLPKDQMSEKAVAYVVSEKGDLVLRTDAAHTASGTPLGNLPMMRRALAGQEGNLEFEDPEGEKYFVVYKPIRELGWGVIVQIPLEEAYEPFRRVARTTLCYFLAGLGVAVFFSLLITRRLTLPIRDLSREMREVSRGNLDTFLRPATDDEMGALTESFNQMIRDLKDSHAALKNAEEKYRSVFEDSKEMFYMTFPDGKYAEINQAGVDLLGYGSKEEMMQVYAKNTFLYPEDQTRFMMEVVKRGFVKDFETKLKRKDGTPIDVLITSNVRKDDSGNMTSYEGFVKNISRRKRVEEELLQRTRELESLYDLSSLVNQSLDMDKVLVVALERALHLSGFEMGAIHLLNETKNILELKFQQGQPPSINENIRFFNVGEGVAGKVVESKRPVIVSIDEYTHPRVAPLLREEGVETVLGIPLLAKERAIGTLTLASHFPHALNQRKINLLLSIGNQIGLALENARLFSEVFKAKSEWETTFDSVTDLITIRDKDFRIIRANQSALKRFGKDPEKVIGSKCYEVLHNRDAACEGCYVYETLRTKKAAYGERVCDYLKGIFQYSTFPLCDEAGEAIGVVDLAREVTEQKRSEMEKEVVNNINKVLASSLDVREVMKAVHSEVRKVMGSERMTFTLLDEEGDGFRYFALEKDYACASSDLMGNGLYPKQGTSFEDVIKTGRPSLVPDTGESDFWMHQRLFREGIRTSLLFPLEYKGKIIGTINLGSREPNRFSEKQFGFLQSIAPGLAISIQNALLFEEIKKRLDEFTILYGIMKISASSSNLDEMLREIAGSLKGFFKSDILGICWVDEHNRLLPHLSYIGASTEDIEKLELRAGKGITGWVAEKGEPLLVNDVRKDARYISSDDAVSSEMCAPLKSGQRVIGIIDAQSRASNAFSENDLRLFGIASGQIAAVIENLRLREEIVQSEEKYRTVVEGALDGICIVGKDNRYKYVNKRLADMMGYSSEELIGLDYRDLMDEEGRQLLEDRSLRRKRGEAVPPSFEFNLVRKDGGVRNVEITVKGIKNSKGSEIISFLKDVTVKKKMEEQFLQSEKLRALGEMASGVAHDFNNALAAILGNTQLLLYTVEDEKTREALKTIESVTKRSGQTVRQLQEFTKRKAQSESLKVDLNTVIEGAMEVTRPKWKDEAQCRGVAMEVTTSLQDVPGVDGSEAELKEVFASLILNAVEAMPDGGRIEIGTYSSGENVCVRVSDTGVGMAEEVKKRAFEPFFTTRPFTNRGLGLSMAYGIIKRCAGTIELESKTGEGTTFTVILPIHRDEKAWSQVHEIEGRKKARILLIDDEEAVRNVLARILSHDDHQVTGAGSGKEGIQLFKEGEFDIVLTDLGMSDMSGWEVCKAIKGLSPDFPVGMITGWGADIDAGKIKDSGIDFFLSKPFQFSDVIQAVGKAIGRDREAGARSKL